MAERQSTALEQELDELRDVFIIRPIIRMRSQGCFDRANWFSEMLNDPKRLEFYRGYADVLRAERERLSKWRVTFHPEAYVEASDG